MSSPERRARQRHDVEFPVRFWSELLEFDGTVQLEGRVADVSWEGLFVRSDYLETPGTPVRLLVDVPEQEPVPLRGTVAWIAEGPPKGPGMGIRLHGAENPMRQAVVELAAEVPR
jgi:hypothetical protein